jgi:farnesyl-diphosphate farnesyltransferase
VSRSFYVSIRLLPRPLREPVAAAYLLARATDTIADTTQLAPPARREKLATLGAAIEGDAAARAAISELATSFAALQQDPDERALILALPQCLAWLDALGNADQRDVRTVLRHITLGQALDIERFGNDAQVCALATAAELEEYTWLVAGCVGEFWTDLCFRHVPGFASLPQEEMRALGRAYGSGLQLIATQAPTWPRGAATFRRTIWPWRHWRRKTSCVSLPGWPGCTATGCNRRATAWPRACATWVRSTTAACAPPAPCRH